MSSKRYNQVLHHAGQCLYRSDTSGIYYAIFKRDGRQIKHSLKTTDKELAKRRLEHLRQKVASLNTKEGKTILFADLAKRWLDTVGGSMKPSSHERRQDSIDALTPYFRATIRSIGKSQIEIWAATRAKEVSARTFNIDRETLIQIFDYAMRHGLILDNPVRIIPRRKQPKVNIVIPTKAQFKILLDTLHTEPRAINAANLCEFLAYSGCRLGEAVAMCWGDVNFDLKTFTVTGGQLRTKNYEVRTVPLFPSLERLLLKMRDSFPIPTQPDDNIFLIRDAKKAINTACGKSGLPHFTHHSLRHFFCSNGVEANINFKTISNWVGHRDGGTLVSKTYSHLRDEHSTAMAKRMTFDVTIDTVEPQNVLQMTTST